VGWGGGDVGDAVADCAAGAHGAEGADVAGGSAAMDGSLVWTAVIADASALGGSPTLTVDVDADGAA
jgi:hypothetical protein